MEQKEVWESLYAKKGRYGLEPCLFAIEALKWFKKTKGAKILDLGGGEGKDSIFFAKNGCEVFCLDFSEKAVKSCKENAVENKVQKFVHPILYDMFKHLKFDDNTFDVVFAHLSLHYFDDETTTKIFDEIHRVLKSGGLLFVKVKSTKDSLYGKGKKVGEDMYELNHVRHFFSREYLLGKAKNFKILSIRETMEKIEYARKSISEESVFLELIGEKS